MMLCFQFSIIFLTLPGQTGAGWIVLSVYCEIWPRGQEMVRPLQARDPIGSSRLNMSGVQKIPVSFFHTNIYSTQMDLGMMEKPL